MSEIGFQMINLSIILGFREGFKENKMNQVMKAESIVMGKVKAKIKRENIQL